LLKSKFMLTFLLLNLIISGCSADSRETFIDEPGLKVVTTIYPVQDIIENLGGDLITTDHILPAGASPHTYEPTVEQARLISDADLFVYIGAGLDEWAVSMAQTAGTSLVLIDLSAEVNLLEAASNHLHESDEDTDHECTDEYEGEEGILNDCEHEHGPVDPHFWLDPLLIRDHVSPAITSALIELAPENRTAFEQYLVDYQGELGQLHEDIELGLSSITDNKFISFHSAWRYFAERYNLKEVAVIAYFPGQEPSAGWLAGLVGLIETEGINAIFAEPQFPTALADRIAEESGVDVLLLDPIGSDNVEGKDNYISLMRYNLEIMIEGLAQ